MEIKQRKGFRTVVAGILCSFLLLALLPLSAAAAAVDYTPLATIKNGLTYPTDVAVSNSGRIYVVDGLTKKVLVYNSGYLLTGAVSSLENPTAVAAFGTMVFVADNSTKSVKFFTDSGTIAGDLKKDGVTATFKLPRNIAIDDSGNIYVVDQFADSIEVFNAAGSYIFTINGLSMPQDAVAVGNELFIIDQPLQGTATKTSGGANADSELRISRVQIFDLGTRTFVDDDTRLFPPYGTDTDAGQYISLKGIAADSGNDDNHIYMNDSFFNVLYKYDTNGQFLGTIDEPVITPLGATVSADGRLFITSSYEGTVKILGVDYDAGAETWLQAPVADAGPDQTVDEGAVFVLDGSDSIDSDPIIAYQWTQVGGVSALPADPFTTDSAQLALTAPPVEAEGSLLLFELVVTDVNNMESAIATTTVTVNNVISGSLIINNGDYYTNNQDVTLSLDVSEAVGMRFANDSDPFEGDYLAYNSTYSWTLSDYDPLIAANDKTVRVEFRDAGGNIAAASSSILLDMQEPAAPTIDIGGSVGEFNWTPVDGAVSYTLEYAFNSDFSDAVTLAGLDLNGLTIALDGLAYGTWFWRVQSIDAADNVSVWSDVGTFINVRPNDLPVADAGPDQTVNEGAAFVLDGSASTDDGGIQSYTWTQIAGTPVLSENPFVAETPSVNVTAPDVGPDGAILTFELVVTDAYSLASEVSTTTVTVNNIISGSVVINDGALYTNDQNVTLSFDAPEAVEMRIANDSDSFSGAYSAYSASSVWTLSDYDPLIEANNKTVRVEFRDAGGNITVASSSILLDMQAPAAPGIDTSGSAGELNWTPVDGAVSYTLEYAFNSDFSDAVTSTGLDLTGLTIVLDGLDYGTWFWRVQSIDAAGNVSVWSDVGTFINVRPNDPPVADAGPDQTVNEGAAFVLDGSASTDDGGIQSYTWTQIAGTPVLGENPLVTESPSIDVTAPDVEFASVTLTFELVVTDVYSLASSVSSTTVTVNNVISGSVVINDGALYTNDQHVTLSFDAPEAVEMRIANDSDPFEGAYLAYNSTYGWTLSDYDPLIEANNKTVRVEFKDAGGNITVAGSSILLDMQPPAVPVIEDIGSSAGEFNWAPVDGAVSYTLEYAFNSDFIGAVTLAGLDFNGLTISLDGLDHGTWFWRVQSIDAAGNISDWSVGTFYIAPDCSAEVPAMPELALPSDNSGDISRTAILETNGMIYPASCGTHLRTEWQVSRISDFSTLVMHIGTTLDNLTVYQIPVLVLEPVTTYFWRVRQVASSGMQSDWSESWLFTTVDEPDEHGVDGVLYVQSDPDADASGEEITIKEAIGDANVKIKAIRVSYGVVAQTVKELDPDTIPDSVNKPSSFPLGLLSFKLTVEPGDFAQVEVTFSGSVPNDAEWYIYNVEEGWHVYAGAIFSRNRRSVTLNFQDGGIGDADGVANGIIVNP